MESTISVLFALAFIGLYFLPTIVAFKKEKANKIPIAIINILLGWTFIGWVIALVWALAQE